ncbi:MAG: PD-(D/E)XK nuclease family protein [Acidobacteriota bacterium]
MPLKGQPYDFPEVVDSTILVTFDACEQRCLNEYVHHLAKSEISQDLHAGGAFAAGIEGTRKALWEQQKSLEASLLDGIRALSIYWGDFEPPPNSKSAKDFPTVACALLDYYREYDPRMDSLRPYMMANGKPAIEFTFALPTEVKHPQTGNPVLYGGRLDMLGYYEDLPVVVDEKTTKNTPSAGWAEQLHMRGQFIGYIWGVQQHGLPFSNVLCRLVVIQKTQYKHIPAIVQIAQWQIERWWEQTNRKIRKMVECWETGDWGYSYGDSCNSYGGCVMLPICVQEEPELFIGDYATRYWNPLEKDPSRRNTPLDAPSA